ncbi:MAG: prepilin-type N-terminal cleavage/methylation domain-containing protein [Candidatus Omnitrophota bacterium]
MLRSDKNKIGLTLIELIIALLLVSFVLVAVWSVYSAGSKVFYGQETRGGVVPEVERALYEFGSDLRRAASVTDAQKTSLTFTSGASSSGKNETMKYVWDDISSHSLNKISTVTKPVVHSVSDLIFTYYDSNNNLLSSPVTPSDVRVVVITMTVTTKNESFKIQNAARIRCL